jgi:hypothetical protein
MRTQFLYAGLLSAVAGALVGTAGCDNITAGQPTDSSAAPRLVHVMIQDARYRFNFPNRAHVVDLIPAQTQQACSDVNPINPCLFSFLEDQVAPVLSCVNGFCTNPLEVPSTGVPLSIPIPAVGGAPDMRDPGGGTQIRLVFDKVLNNAIEKVTIDPTKAPGSNDTYTIQAGLVELDDATGKAVDTVTYYDNGGTAAVATNNTVAFPADIMSDPLGAAIVMKPTSELADNAKYTIKIVNAGAIQDREGHNAVGVDGNALPTSFSFTTEKLISVAAATTAQVAGAFGPAPYDYPAFIDGSAAPAAGTIAPNEVIQISFYNVAAGDKAKATITSGPAGAKAIMFTDRGADLTMCSKTSDMGGGYILDVVNTDTGDLTGAPVDWPVGDYKMTITVPSASGNSTFTSTELDFTVKAGAMGDVTDPTMDGNIFSTDTAALKKAGAGHLLPSQCMMP